MVYDTLYGGGKIQTKMRKKGTGVPFLMEGFLGGKNPDRIQLLPSVFVLCYENVDNLWITFFWVEVVCNDFVCIFVCSIFNP